MINALVIKKSKSSSHIRIIFLQQRVSCLYILVISLLILLLRCLHILDKAYALRGYLQKKGEASMNVLMALCRHDQRSGTQSHHNYTEAEIMIPDAVHAE